MRAIMFRVAVILPILAMTPVSAEVANYGTFKIARFHQATPAPPETLDFPNAYCFGARLFTVHPGEVTNAAVTPPIGSIRDLSDPGPLCLDYHGGRFFGSKDELDAAFPNGNYVFEINGASEAASLAIPTTELYPSAIPAIAPECWTALQTLDASKPFTLVWNAFSRHPSADAASTLPYNMTS